MRPRRYLDWIALLMVFGLKIQAQSNPNFTGTWTTVPELVPNSPLPEKGRTGLGAKGTVRLKIAEVGGKLTISGTAVADTFALDGSETTNCIRIEGQCVPSKCRAHWDAKRLILGCRFELPGAGQVLTTQKLGIDADGNLRVEFRTLSADFNLLLRGTYMRQSDIVFDLGEKL